MQFRPALRLTSSAVLLTLILTSCSGDPQAHKMKHFQSGQHYFEKGKYEEAAIEFINAVKIDANYAEAHQQLAETYLKLNKPQIALQEIGRTIQLQPDNYSARLELANLLILGHNLREAQTEVDALLKEHSGDAAAHSAKSSLMAAQGDLMGAIAEMQTTIGLNPDHWQFYLSLALLQSRSNQPDAAEASLRKVIELDPTSPQARVLLGKYYQSRNRYSDSERLFREASEADPTTPEPRAALAELYLKEGKQLEAQEIARRAGRDLPNNSTAYRMLAKVYVMSGDMDEALVEYSVVTHAHPQDLQAKKEYIQLLLQKGRIGEADQFDTEILKVRPNDPDALLYRSEIQVSSGGANDAMAALETLIRNDPGNSEAHYVMGIAFEKLGNPERAEGEWREAVRLRSDLLDAVRALAHSALNRGDMDALDLEATEIIRIRSASAEGYALRALANLNRKRLSAAEADARKAIEVAPQNSLGYVQLGNVKLVEKQFDDAGKAYQSALDRNPNSKDGLRGLMSARLAQKKVDQAISAAYAQIAKAPNNSGFHELLGTALFLNKKDLQGAEAAFEKSTALDSKNVGAQLRLIQVQTARGAKDQAIATCKGALANNPNEPSLYIMLGDLDRSRKDWTGAADAYQKALALKTDNPQASHDLASVMLQSGGNLDVALSLAQAARRGMPNSPAVADTLGWIYYQKGAYTLAVDSLREALRLEEKAGAADNPAFHYHLGMAYAKTGETTLARQQLQQALRLDPDATDAQVAKKQLAELKS